ncbi:aromatase/cyclase, partial [Dactylosporangium sp. NPDC000555]|uniref:aromatase/cyclase n=1 Tax=Dactylosporangium sp. NPDC000555 TaxID=3154260 RepID=UPI003316E888
MSIVVHEPAGSVTHAVQVAAPPELCFALVADVTEAPRYFPSHLHAEVEPADDGRELVHRWVVGPGGAVRDWRAERVVDRAARRIVFGHAGDRAPVTATHGEWTFAAGDGDTCLVTLVHTLTVEGRADAEAVRVAVAEVDRAAAAQVEQLRRVAESFAELTARTVCVEDSVLVACAADGAWRRLVAAAGDLPGAGYAGLPRRRVV